jgi:hypothetical protein
MHRSVFGEGATLSLPHLSPPDLSPRGFVVCPLPLQASLLQQGGWVQAIYALAFQQAQEALRPTWYERLQASSIN